MSNEPCEQCGCPFAFPEEWCTCNMSDRQKQMLDDAHHEHLKREVEITELKATVAARDFFISKYCREMVAPSDVLKQNEVSEDE